MNKGKCGWGNDTKRKAESEKAETRREVYRLNRRNIQHLTFNAQHLTNKGSHSTRPLNRNMHRRGEAE